MREAACSPRDVSGLGSGAYAPTVGRREQLVVHGGSVVLVIEASGGAAVAEGAARATLVALEVL